MGTDFLDSDFPMYAAGAVGVFVAYRAFLVSLKTEPILEHYFHVFYLQFDAIGVGTTPS